MLELVEELGLGRITPGQIDEGDMEKRVGDILAEVVQEYRKAMQRSKEGKPPAWEQEMKQQQQQSNTEAQVGPLLGSGDAWNCFIWGSVQP